MADPQVIFWESTLAVASPVPAVGSSDAAAMSTGASLAPGPRGAGRHESPYLAGEALLSWISSKP
jgi:hypothetical protein